MKRDQEVTEVRLRLDAVDLARLEAAACRHGVSVDEIAARLLHRAALRLSDGAYESLLGADGTCGSLPH